MMFNQYPYLNLNDLNLDYILAQIKTMMNEVTNFVSINAIKYADPIQWDITRQYEKNTVVIDSVTGTAYISVAPVPAGVALTRPEYWTVVFDLGSFVTRAAQNFTSRYEQETTLTATFPTNTGEWLVWGDVLYKAKTNIIAGDTYVVDSNIEHFTMEDLYNAYLNTIAQILAMVGNLTDLATADKTSIVNAINDVVANLAQEVIDRTNEIARIETMIDNGRVVNVIDEGAVGDGVTDDTNAIKAAISKAETLKYIVFFPAGRYYISDTLNVDYEGAVIVGDMATIVGDNVHDILHLGDNAHVAYVKILGLTFENTATNSCVGLKIRDAFLTTIMRCKFINMGVGVEINDIAYGIALCECNIYDSYDAAILYDTGGVSTLANGLSLMRVTADNSLHGQPTIGGIVCRSGEGLYAIDCEFIHQKNGLMIAPDAATKSCRFYIVSNCVFDLCSSNNIYIGTDTGRIEIISLCNVWSGTADSEGVLIENNGGVIVDVKLNAMQILNNNIGVWVKQTAGTVNDIIIANSSLLGNSRVADGTHDAIIVTGDVNGVIISNNIFDYIVGTQNRHNHAITIGAFVNDVLITNNVIKNCVNMPFSNSSDRYILFENNLNVAITHYIHIPSTEMKSSGNAVDSYVLNGTNSPACITMAREQDSFASFAFKMPEKSAVAGQTKIKLQFMVYNTTTSPITLKIHYGIELFGNSYTNATETVTLNSGYASGTIHNVDVLTIPNTNAGEIWYVNVERDGTDSELETVAILGASVEYLSL